MAQGRPSTAFLKGLPFLSSSGGQPQIALTSAQRESLLRIGLRTRLPPRTVIFDSGAPAEWVWVISEGVVKCYRELPSGKHAVCAFLFARDLFGLAENGLYLNSAKTVTEVTMYRLALSELADLLKQDGELQFHFLTKITHELRESQRRALLLGRRDAPGRFAMFIALMAKRAGVRDEHGPVIDLPMTRSDIAAFLGLSLEATSRAASELERRRLVQFITRHQVRILSAARFTRLVAES